MKHGTPIVTPFFLALACLATVGCGSLSVEVAVLDPEVLLDGQTEIATAENRARLAQQLSRILALDGADIDRLVDQVAQAHFEHYTQVGAILAQEGHPEEKMQLQNDFNLGIRPRYDQAKEKLKAVRRSLESLAERRSTAQGPARESIEEDLLVRLHQWTHHLRALEATAARDMADLDQHVASALSEDGEMSETETARVQAAVQAARQEPESRQARATSEAVAQQALATLSGGTLDADPLVGTVAGADEGDWHRTFHEVWGRGLLGSFNMAIKMEKGPSRNTFPEFTLKGLTFDPSDVARMASRVTSQALALGARMAGVSLTNVSGAATPPAGSAFTAVASPLAAQQANVSNATRSARVHDAALQNLAVVILQAWDDLTDPSDAAARKAAIDALKASFAALQPNLRSAPQPTPSPAPAAKEEEQEEEESSSEDEGESSENENEEQGGEEEETEKGDGSSDADEVEKEDEEEDEEEDEAEDDEPGSDTTGGRS